MTDGPIALVGGRLCVLPSTGGAPIPVDAPPMGAIPIGAATAVNGGTIPGLPPDVIDRLRKWFPLRTHFRTSNPPVGTDALASALWSPEPLRVGCILSLKGAPGDIFLTERADITAKGFDAPTGAVLTFDQACPETLFAFSASGAFNASVMEILRFSTDG